MPKVSIIMPTYGRTDFLFESIESVFSQTYGDFEFILVDDNNPDSSFRKQTSEIVQRHEKFGHKIKYIQHPCNLNGATARNTGFAHSSGRYISFLDSDDFYDPKRLEVAVSVLEGTPADVGGVFTGVEFRRNGKKFATHLDVLSGNFLVETLACQFMLGTGSNLFVKREVFERLHGFDEAFERHQDYEFLVRFFERYQIAARAESLVIKNNENFNLPPFRRSYGIKKQYLEKFHPLVSSLSDVDKQYVMAKNYEALGEHALREGLRTESSEMYLIARANGSLGLRRSLRRAILWILSWRR